MAHHERRIDENPLRRHRHTAPRSLGLLWLPPGHQPEHRCTCIPWWRFTNVYASDVPCLPSRTALITGMFGIRNGVANHGGLAADLRPWGADRDFFSKLAIDSFAGVLIGAGYHTASISSFPLRHSAPWWTSGFLESMNLVRGFGSERADEALPGALDWLERRGRADNWFLHVHLWDPHTPYNVPEKFGNPFADEPVPDWHTDAVRQRNWDLPGPHSAKEPWGFRPDEWGTPPPRQPWNLATPENVHAIFDGYDVGIRYADDAVGIVCSKLADIDVLDETAIWIGSDHGEAFGELGVYADHMGADEATAHIPTVLSWPGLPGGVQEGLHYHLDIAATVADLAGARVPEHWDGCTFRGELEAGADAAGRAHLVLTKVRGHASVECASGTTSTCTPRTTVSMPPGPMRCSSTWCPTPTSRWTWPQSAKSSSRMAGQSSLSGPRPNSTGPWPPNATLWRSCWTRGVRTMFVDICPLTSGACRRQGAPGGLSPCWSDTERTRGGSGGTAKRERCPLGRPDFVLPDSHTPRRSRPLGGSVPALKWRSIGSRGAYRRPFARTTRRLPEGRWDPTKIPRNRFRVSRGSALVEPSESIFTLVGSHPSGVGTNRSKP